MPTYKLIISYDGSRYAGWQTQQSRHSQAAICKLRTVQGEIESVLFKIFKKKIKVEGSGRTDSGVHAVFQVAHFQTDRLLDAGKIKIAFNGLLPSDIVVLDLKNERDNFHSRFEAKHKTYRYVIINTPVRPVFLPNYGYWVRFPLDISLMRQEAQALLGRHNFKSFQASDRVQRSENTTINSIKIRRSAGADTFPFLKNMTLVLIDIEATGFLRGMVRNIAGTLCDVGRGRLLKGAVKKILKRKDRRAAGFCAPAQGLYLLKVDYD